MPITKKVKAAAAASVLAMGGFALAAGAPALAHNHGEKKSQPNIVEAAMSTGIHETLVTAVDTAGLVETLSSPGPYTVFAPTDDAFGELPDGTVESLLLPENRDTLTTVLTYHVVEGRIPAARLSQAIRQAGGSYEFETLAGETLTASFDGSAIVVTDAAGREAEVVQADVKTTNGVIHVTDSVFLPG